MKTETGTGPKMGRPSIFSPELADAICERIAGGESLRTICKDQNMPGTRTVLDWLCDEEPEKKTFRARYTRAREAMADALAEECLEIADDGTNDWMERRGNTPGYEMNGEAAARSRLRLEQRRWYAAKLAPKKYGDKLDLTGAGQFQVPVINVVVQAPPGSDAK